MTRAFHDDPAWSWAFPDVAERSRQFAALWEVMISSALRYPWVRMTTGAEAAAVWIPPGESEFTEEAEEGLPGLLEGLVGERASAVLEFMDRFDQAHPQDEPHYYLSLLATHPAHAGQGLGMGVLADSLNLIDEQRYPAYLESSNPANNPRYQRYGFEAVGEFYPPGGKIPLTTMWRPAR